MPRIELRLQPDPALLRVMRVTIASAARVQRLDESLVEDIRLAATEATAEAMAAHTDAEIGDAVVVGLDVADHEAVVSVDHVAGRGRPRTAADEGVDRLAVAAGVADGFEVRTAGAGTTRIEMRWSTEPLS
ncbi:ATP-binding protein [Solicola gregarius]|uniref:ATP-binding protein n=1 Tax=Solicola gregarius TaxID=2908642 RepID=A0AA46YIR1_9ACTN|nr:ATP-binding protein [Solicola gregarius]UYM03375.1 ATP-binding protein [Solicola gregarius]